MRAKMAGTVVILQDYGYELREPYSKHLEEGGRRMNSKFNDFLEEQLRDPEFRKEYEALQPERAVIRAIIEARRQSGLTQKELAERTGIAQGDISKLENGNANPSIRTLQRLANGMGMTLKVEFIPRKAVNG